MLAINNIHLDYKPLITPSELINQLPASSILLDFVHQARISAENIIKGKDHRLLVIIGPCSIHDTHAAIEYAENLKLASIRFCDDLHIIMRVYFQKPRTTLGWKGLINDPFLNNTHDINRGVWLARKLLMDLNKMQLPAATEFVDPMIHYYLSDLISWTAIGARTVESQSHRELASGLSMPVGFKNNTDGNIKVAIDAVTTAKQSHQYIGMTMQGNPSIVLTKGNDQCHVILRGSTHTTNYAIAEVSKTANNLIKAGLTPSLMIDCSHGNSMKDYHRQRDVLHHIALQIENGSSSICGIMLESFLIAGNQKLNPNKPLVYGQSITDECLNWKDSLALLETIALSVHRRNLMKITK